MFSLSENYSQIALIFQCRKRGEMRRVNWLGIRKAKGQAKYTRYRNYSRTDPRIVRGKRYTSRQPSLGTGIMNNFNVPNTQPQTHLH